MLKGVKKVFSCTTKNERDDSPYMVRFIGKHLTKSLGFCTARWRSQRPRGGALFKDQQTTSPPQFGHGFSSIGWNEAKTIPASFGSNQATNLYEIGPDSIETPPMKPPVFSSSLERNIANGNSKVKKEETKDSRSCSGQVCLNSFYLKFSWYIGTETA